MFLTEPTLLMALVFDQEIENNTIKGKLKIRSRESLKINSIYGLLEANLQDRISNTAIDSIKFDISKFTNIVTGIDYEFPFTINDVDKCIPEYNGKNLKISHDIKAIIMVDEDDLDKVKKDFVSKVVDFFMNQNFITVKRKIILPPQNKKYIVKEGNYKLKLTSKRSISFLSIVISFFSVIWTLKYFNSFGFVSFFVAIGTGYWIVNNLIKSLFNFILKSSLVQLSNNDDGFEVKIFKPKLIRFSKAQMYYQIIEVSKDRHRGDKTGDRVHTVSEIIYQTPNVTLSDGITSLVHFDFPQKRDMISFNAGERGVYWELNLKTKWMGLVFLFEANFEVDNE